MKLLFVCTGNQCRSPMAAGLAGEKLGQRGCEAELLSAGFNADGVSAPDQVVNAMAEVGIDLRWHRSRLINVELIESADVVIAMTAQHLIGTITVAPGEWERCFTLSDLVTRAEAAGPRAYAQSVRSWARFLGAGRVRSRLLRLPASGDIADPMGGRTRDYERTRDVLRFPFGPFGSLNLPIAVKVRTGATGLKETDKSPSHPLTKKTLCVLVCSPRTLNGLPGPQALPDRHVAKSRRRKVSRRSKSRWTVWVLAAAAAVGGSFAGAHPTNTPIVDPLYAAFLAGLVTLACATASRWTWLLLSFAAVAMSRSWMLLVGLTALGVAFASVFPRRHRRLGGLVGALAMQAVLRWPHELFYGFPTVVAAVALTPCLVSAYLHLGSMWRRRLRWTTAGVAAVAVVLGIPLVVGGLLARGPITRGVADAQGALDAVSDGGGASANARLTVAAADFTVGHQRTSAWWTAGAALIPVESQQRRAVAHATAAGAAITSTARDVSGSLSTLRSSYHQGAIDLASITALAQPVRRLDARLARAQHDLAASSSAWLIQPLQSRLTRLGAELNRAKSTTDLADQAVPVLPGLLGADGPRHYFLAFMTPSESRGLDGFIAAYGILTANDGHLSLTASGPIGQLIATAKPGQRHLSGPADYLARYGEFDPAYYLQDLSYSPDFPTVANVISQLYPQTGGQPLDGVVALDPYALAELLHFTGPITVPGLPGRLTAANAAQVLTVGQYATFPSGGVATNVTRHDFLQGALKVAFTKLSAGSLPSPRTLGADLGPVVRQGRLLFWSNHASEQPLLQSVGLAGSFPHADGGDLLAVTTQNAANNKIDAYLHRSIDDQVTYDPVTGEVDSTVTVSLHNAAPASGLPPYVLGSYTGSGIPQGTNRTWISLYSPLTFLRGTDGATVLDVDSVPEFGIHTYSTHVDIGPGQTATLKLVLSGHIKPGPTYTLTVRNQPTVIPDLVLTHVSPTAGWIPKPSEPTRPSGDEDQTTTFRFKRS